MYRNEREANMYWLPQRTRTLIEGVTWTRPTRVQRPKPTSYRVPATVYALASLACIAALPAFVYFFPNGL